MEAERLEWQLTSLDPDVHDRPNVHRAGAGLNERTVAEWSWADRFGSLSIRQTCRGGTKLFRGSSMPDYPLCRAEAVVRLSGNQFECRHIARCEAQRRREIACAAK